MSEYHKINAPFMRDNKGVMQHGLWCRQEFEYLADKDWEFTEKVDGTNIRLVFTGPEAEWDILGRTDRAQTPKPLLTVLDDLCHRVSPKITVVMRERGIDSMTLYGEGYGPKINGGGKYADTPKFVLFDIRVGSFWLTREAVNTFGESVGIDTVPVLGVGSLWDAIQMVRYGTRTVDGQIFNVNKDGAMDRLSSRWGDFEAEGIIATPVVPLFDRAGNRIITKIKSKDFRS